MNDSRNSGGAYHLVYDLAQLGNTKIKELSKLIDYHGGSDRLKADISKLCQYMAELERDNRRYENERRVKSRVHYLLQ